MDLLELKRSYSDISQLVKEVESAQHSVEDHNKHLTDVNLDNDPCASYIKKRLKIMVYKKLSK